MPGPTTSIQRIERETGEKRLTRYGDDLAIELEETGSEGRYVHRGLDGAEAEMTFSKAGERLIIVDHTEVPEAFRGQGVGLRLVERAVEDARNSGKTILPLCPFAAAQFRRHPEWDDVLNASTRRRRDDSPGHDGQAEGDMMASGELDIRFEQDGQRGKYSVAMPDGSEARLTFVRVAPDHIVADHTFVPVPYRDQDIAERMVERLIADVRTNNDKITPTCWFVADEFKHHSPEWDDLLKQ